jgi:hypothetical protein
MKGWRTLVVAATLVASVAVARPARAAALEEAGWGSLTVLTNVLYMPAKLIYSALGGLTGGLAFALTGGDMNPAETVWVTTMSGTYVVTPSMLRGEEAIAFVGVPEGEATTETSAEVGSARDLQEQHLGDSPGA